MTKRLNIMKALTKSYTSKIEQLRTALGGIKQDLITAGKLLVEMIEENEDTFEILVGQGVASLRTLEALERIGRGKLDPLLLTDPSPIAHRAISQALPMAQQRQIQSQTIAVAYDNGDSGYAIKHKRKDEITLAESYRIIGDGRIRTADEQIEILKASKARVLSRNAAYVIDQERGCVRLLEDREFTYEQLCELAEKIKPRAEDIAKSMVKRQITKS